MLAAEVGKPHGINGEVYLVRISDDPRRFEPGATLLRRDGTELLIESARPHRDRFLVKFSGYDSRDEAERLRGPLYVSGAGVRELGEGEFWLHELVGARVRTVDGTDIGSLARVTPGPAQDLLVVETPRGERMVPFVRDIVTQVDTQERLITVDPPAGLLD